MQRIGYSIYILTPTEWRAKTQLVLNSSQQKVQKAATVLHTHGNDILI